MKKFALMLMSFIMSALFAVPCFAVSTLDDLVTAAGLGGLVTSTTAAIVVVAAIPLAFACFALYRKIMARGVGR